MQRNFGAWLTRTQLEDRFAQFAQRSITQTKNLGAGPGWASPGMPSDGLNSRLCAGQFCSRASGFPDGPASFRRLCPAQHLRICNWFPLIILLILKTPELNSEKRSGSL